MRSADKRTMPASPSPSCGWVKPLEQRSMMVCEDERGPRDTGLLFPDGSPILKWPAPRVRAGFYPLKERC